MNILSVLMTNQIKRNHFFVHVISETRGPICLPILLMRLGKLMHTITEFVCVGEIVTYA